MLPSDNRTLDELLVPWASSRTPRIAAGACRISIRELRQPSISGLSTAAFSGALTLTLRDVRPVWRGILGKLA
jgi:hypothetical protein